MPKKKQPKILGWNNVETFEWEEMMEQLEAILLKKVPEGIRTKEEIEIANVMLGWLANQYAFVESLHTRMGSLASRTGQEDKTDPTYKEYVQMRDTLEKVSSSLKLKYQAVSRMLTIVIGGDGEGKIGGGSNTGQGGGWNSVPGRR